MLKRMWTYFVFRDRQRVQKQIDELNAQSNPTMGLKIVQPKPRGKIKIKKKKEK